MKLNKIEKRTFLLLMVAAFFNGFVTSAFQIQEIIAKKALMALDWQITILVMLWPISNILSIWWGKLLEHSPNVSRFFLLVGFIGRLSLILMLWVNGFYGFLMIMVVLFSFNALISPAQNSIYKTNITKANRGKLFGYVSSITTLVMILASYVFGKLLDVNEDWFRYIFLGVGFSGFISAMFMAAINSEKIVKNKEKFVLKEFFFQPIHSFMEVLKRNKHFAQFQLGFFLYGIGFMVMLPAIPKYLVEYLHMDYSQTFLGKAIIAQLGILILAPLAGKIHDHINPAKFTAMAFTSLALYPLIMLISSFLIGTVWANYVAYLSFFVFGLAMSGIIISWNISSIFFAGDEDVSLYQGVHVTLTGLRGIFAPFLGFFVLRYMGIRTVFVISITMLLVGALVCLHLYLKMKDENFNLSKVQLFRYFKKIFPVS